jgi:hypothetical protein
MGYRLLHMWSENAPENEGLILPLVSIKRRRDILTDELHHFLKREGFPGSMHLPEPLEGYDHSIFNLLERHLVCALKI